MPKTETHKLADLLRQAIKADPRSATAIGMAAGVYASTMGRLMEGSDCYTATADKLAVELGITYRWKR